MKLSNYKKDYYEFSGLASGASRQACFAGIALIWLFKSQSGTEISIPSTLLFPLAALVASLTAELLQYLLGTVIWKIFFLHHEAKHPLGADPEIDAPSWPQILITFLFFTKIGAVVFAYLLIFAYCLKSIAFVE